jgi:hypothetical protein
VKIDPRTVPALLAFLAVLAFLGVATYVVAVNKGSTDQVQGLVPFAGALAVLVAAFLGKRPPKGPQ